MGRTDTIGLSVLDVNHPQFSSILNGAERLARNHVEPVPLVDIILAATGAARPDGRAPGLARADHMSTG